MVENQIKASAIKHYKQGRVKYDLGQYAEAILDYNFAIALKPDYAEALSDRGCAKVELKQYSAAITDYSTTIKLEPNDANTYYKRGNAKTKLNQNEEAKQDWRTALKLATQTGNTELKNLVESLLRQFGGYQVKEKSVHYSEDQIKDIVADYFESLPIISLGYSVKREYIIQMGSDQRRADIVLLRNGKLVAIAECKETGRVGKGIQQLYSYLCATDTYLGIFANNGDLNQWTFWENHRHNNFVEIDRKTFENYVYNHDKTIKDRENKIKAEVQNEIDVEIRERIRKNTDTDAIREDETNRIKQEVMEDIDRTALVNSVKSEIAQQAENGLLKERDKANRKLGREQGFLLTIFSLIGLVILIGLLVTSG